jgi:hypothetical protein
MIEPIDDPEKGIHVGPSSSVDSVVIGQTTTRPLGGRAKAS